MSKFPILRMMISVLLGLTLAVTTAAAEDKTVIVKFPRGASGTSIDASIRGYDGINYIVGVSAGQKMSVQLDTDNASNYFNITGPGASEALFNGSISGNSTTFDIPSSGNYVINVYLMRNAARRNETANFELTIYVEGKAAAVAPAPVQPDHADGLTGGPDYWHVTGLAAGDKLNIRASASTSAAVLGTLRNGDVMANLGCSVVSGTRWCHVRTRGGLVGWVAGRYLHEDFEDAASTLPTPPVQPAPALPAPVQASVDLDMMQRYCQGEASAKVDTRPTSLRLTPAKSFGRGYVVTGSYPPADGQLGTFQCFFSGEGAFIGATAQ